MPKSLAWHLGWPAVLAIASLLLIGGVILSICFIHVLRVTSQAPRVASGRLGEIDKILQEGTALRLAETRRLSAKWRKRLEGRSFSDSTELIREDRDSR